MEGSKTLREICEVLGVTRRAVQGYEKAGLVSASDRNKYGHLLYDEESRKKIARIKLYQQLGFTIKEIQSLVDAPAPVIKENLERQIVYLREKQAQIEDLIKEANGLINSI